MTTSVVTEANLQLKLTDSRVDQHQEIQTARIDPYWNFVARTALMYSVPLLALAVVVHRMKSWVSVDFWVPFSFAFLVLAPATRLTFGRLFVHKDFQGRDRFLSFYSILPASVWYLAVGSVPTVIGGAIFFVVILVYDAMLVRSDLLCVYGIGAPLRGRNILEVLLRFSVPVWGYLSLMLVLIHRFARNTLPMIAAASLLTAAPPAFLWLFWYKRRRPVLSFKGIRNVAVIGAGWSGIYGVKWLSEAGINATCFEETDSLGGVWMYRPNRAGGVFESARVTSSKHFLHPSDFPLPPSAPEFPHHTQILDHLNRYVEHFGIRDRIRLGVKVLAVEPCGVAWRVVTSSGDGSRNEEVFDAVVVSTGPHQNPNIDPALHPLYGNFTGRLMHSAEYKRGTDVSKGETVLIVGAGESSADIVAECVNQGAIVHWASRSGQWFADRNMGPFPADHITTQGTRVFFGLFGFSEYLVRRFITGAFVNLAWGRAGHGIPEWIPQAPYLHQFLNKSRDGVLEVYRGRVVPHRGPTKIVGRLVFFGEESVAADTIILSTGYRPVWPFLWEQPKALYKLVFHPAMPTLAFIGFARPIVGSIPSLGELQAQWIAKAWSGRVTLPARDRIQTEMHFDRKFHERLIRDSSELGMMVDQELYATELASRSNVHVHWAKLLFSWPRAFFVLLASPWIPFKYRLNDPDRDRRRRALDNIVRELPSPRAPSYLLGIGIGATALAMAVFAIIAFLAFAPDLAIALLAAIGLGFACGLRFTERHRKDPSRSMVRRAVREVFPF